jgi:hypothetical protein
MPLVARYPQRVPKRIGAVPDKPVYSLFRGQSSGRRMRLARMQPVEGYSAFRERAGSPHPATSRDDALPGPYEGVGDFPNLTPKGAVGVFACTGQ